MKASSPNDCDDSKNLGSPEGAMNDDQYPIVPIDVFLSTIAYRPEQPHEIAPHRDFYFPPAESAPEESSAQTDAEEAGRRQP